MGALNFITTTLDLRAKGMTMMRMPLTCWAWFITAILGLLAFGVSALGGNSVCCSTAISGPVSTFRWWW